MFTHIYAFVSDVEELGNEHTNRTVKTSFWRMRYTKQVHPTSALMSRTSDKHSPQSDYYRSVHTGCFLKQIDYFPTEPEIFLKW